MEKIELLKEIERKVISNLMDKEAIPLELKRLTQRLFAQLENNYQQLGCDFPSTISYIEGALKEALFKVTETGEKIHKEAQIWQVQCVFRNIEQGLEEVRNLEDEPREEQKNRDEMEQIEGKNNKTTNRILDIIEDGMKDIQVAHNRHLEARGYTENEIQDIQYQTKNFMQRLLNQNSEKINGILEQDDEELKEELLAEYEQFLRQTKEEKTKREEFVEELDSGLSLENQKVFAMDRQEKEKQNNEDQFKLSDDVIK